MSRKLVVVLLVSVLMITSSILFRFRITYALPYIDQDIVVLAPYHWNVNKNETMFSLKSDHEKNYTDFLTLLDKAKDIGFNSIALHDVSLFYDDGILNQTLGDIESSNLNVILYIVWRDKTVNCTFETGNTSESYWSVDFPLNVTQHEAFVDYLRNVSIIASSFPCVKGYALFYPFDRTDAYVKDNVDNPNYKRFLQNYTNTIKMYDPKPVFLVSDMVESINTTALPYDISGIDGYGFTFYSNVTDNINEPLLDWYRSFYEDKLAEYVPDGELFIAEWSWKTNPFDATYASATSNVTKAALIVDMINYTRRHNLSHAYFCLHDIPHANYSKGDWGLIDNQFEYRCSGLVMKLVIPEYPSLIILPLFMIATLLTVMMYRKKQYIPQESKNYD